VLDKHCGQFVTLYNNEVSPQVGAFAVSSQKWGELCHIAANMRIRGNNADISADIR